MSYQTGTPTSPVNLLQTLVTWLVSIGWTQDRSAVEGAGWTATLHRNGNYVNLRATVNEANLPWATNFGNAHYGLHMYLGTGFNGANLFNNQPGGPVASGTSQSIGVGMLLAVGPFSNYYFFADATADNIVMVVEKTPGLYLHMGWGLSLQKAGSYTGGAYFFGSSSGYNASFANPVANVPGFTATSDCPFANKDQEAGGCAFVRADVDSWIGKWIGIFNGATGFLGFTGKIGDTSMRGAGLPMSTNFPVYANGAGATQFQSEQTSQQDGRANLLPLILWVNRDGTTTGFSMLGTPPNIFFTNGVGHGFSNVDEYLLGGTTYKMFPNFAVIKQ
jgi:hypothetical protein